MAETIPLAVTGGESVSINLTTDTLAIDGSASSDDLNAAVSGFNVLVVTKAPRLQQQCF